MRVSCVFSICPRLDFQDYYNGNTTALYRNLELELNFYSIFFIINKINFINSITLSVAKSTYPADWSEKYSNGACFNRDSIFLIYVSYTLFIVYHIKTNKANLFTKTIISRIRGVGRFNWKILHWLMRLLQQGLGF